MDDLTSKYYEFRELLSETPHIQTWLALNRDSGEYCVVKIPAPDSDPETVNRLLRSSFRWQRNLRSSSVLYGKRKITEYKRALIEYELLDRSQWVPVTPSLFWEYFPDILVQICLISDLVHESGLIHGDLKVENFLLHESESAPRLKLIDTEFLIGEQQPLRPLIIGTPGNIAPEVVSNETFVTQSDVYSLGQSLRRMLEPALREPSDTDKIEPLVLSKLNALADRLTVVEYTERPKYLLEELYRAGLVDDSQYTGALSILLSKVLLSQFSIAGSEKIKDSTELDKIVRYKCRVLGFTGGMSGAIAASWAKSRLATVRVIRDFLRAATIRKIADYWHVDSGDEELEKLYSNLELISNGRTLVDQIEGIDSEQRLVSALQTADALESNGSLDRAYLILSHACVDADDDGNRISTEAIGKLLIKRGSIAKKLNRLDEAERYYSRYLELAKKENNSGDHVIDETIALRYALGQGDRARELIEVVLGSADTASVSDLELNVRRMKAWLDGAEGKFDIAMRELEAIVELASERNYARTLMLALYSIGVLHWRSGKREEAFSLVKRSVDVAKENGLLARATPMLATLSVLSSDLADYLAAAHYGRLAFSESDETGNDSQLPHICVAISYAHTRLAEFDKAGHWVQRYLSVGRYISDKRYLSNFYLMKGFLELNQGKLAAAKESLQIANMLVKNDPPSKVAGQVFLNLSDLALMEGDLIACKDYASEGSKIFTSIGDLSSAAEIDLIAAIGEFLGASPSEPDRLYERFNKAVEQENYFTSIRALLFLILCGLVDSKLLSHSIGRLKPKIDESTAPLFRAVKTLLDVKRDNSDSSRHNIDSLKEAARAIAGRGSRFELSYLYEKLAEEYLSIGKVRHAAKYMNQALQLAKALSNRIRADALEKRIEQMNAPSRNQDELMAAFHSISMILQDMDSTEESLGHVLQFALDYTGAERAVLLLKRRSQDDFYSAASINCDDESVADITRISKNVVRQVAQGSDPLVISDALSDKRTKDFKSIAIHNILSVACIPLSDGQSMSGVLYLDHHTIPSLFNSLDIKFLRAIANYLSTIISALGSYKGLKHSNQKLREDLTDLGTGGAFITTDPNTMSLIDKIPEIARSDVPILITGESGTGKEVLCQMIHDASMRDKGPLVRLNCAAISSTLTESELFGVEKNVATGVAPREGKLSAADGGTLLLDEIGDMALETQAKLLRVIEYRHFEKLGSNRPIYADVRFICATNRDLPGMIDKGEFRKDLYYRINTIVIEIPPLRDRPGDIELLMEHFLRLFSVGRERPRIDNSAMKRLRAYSWPGNVRELRNFVERACILSPGRKLDESSLPQDASDGWKKLAEESDNDEIRLRFTKALIEKGWNQSKAARSLGIPLSTFRRKLKILGIRRSDKAS